MNKEVIEIVKEFNRYNPGWTANGEYNRIYLRTLFNYCSEQLRYRGYLFLNDVYQELGFPMTKEGQTAGWVLSEDGYVDFACDVYPKEDGSDDLIIRLKPINNILDVLPNETEES